MEDQRITRIAKALADPVRWQMLKDIAARGEMSCGELTGQCPVAQATVSHHLKILGDCGLVTARRAGQFRYFRVVPAVLQEFLTALGGAVATRPSRGKGPTARPRPSPITRSRPVRRTR